MVAPSCGTEVEDAPVEQLPVVLCPVPGAKVRPVDAGPHAQAFWSENFVCSLGGSRGLHIGDVDVKTRRQLQLCFDADCRLFSY